MPRANRYFFDEGGVTCNLRQAEVDKRIDFRCGMIAISDENAAFFGLYFS